ncbi:PREDICTED: sporamin B-like [Ipomoea nil]|uniref:sporamin B-like n=1 Tax=Ipomoea nil TaxID=35883 RepID=UPI00090179A8|nr:PREDICTED: sporamin B-like [Ipomoea nil]
MKTLAVLLFALSLNLLPNPTHSTFNPIRLPTADDTPVLDTDGDELRAGGVYIIASGPVEVSLSRIRASTCPNVVSIASFSRGVPVTITPADPNATVISPSTYLSFSFNNVCAKKLYWLVDRYPESETKSPYFVNAGDFLPNNSNQFKIEAEPNSNRNAYKITYCHFGSDECNNVSSRFYAWLRSSRLVLSDKPFVVVFKKANN